MTLLREHRQVLTERIKKEKRVKKFHEKRWLKKKLKDVIHPKINILNMPIYLN